MDVDRRQTGLAQRAVEARTLQDLEAGPAGSSPPTPLPKPGSAGDKSWTVDPPTPTPVADGSVGRSASAGGLPPLRCRFDHWHPPQPLRAATRNPMRSYGLPPYHCADCPAASGPETRPEYWLEYATPADAIQAGHVQPCVRCFPPSRRRAG